MSKLNSLKPLYRDPIYDGAADPMVIYNHIQGNWWMFYTQRHSNVKSRGVDSAYGSKIGIAISDDGGNYWYYTGTLDLEFEFGHNTFWAPEIIFYEDKYHMFVSYIRGIHYLWAGKRDIIHYTSNNLENWKKEKSLDLESGGIIDPCIFQLPDGDFRMWYKDECQNSYTVYADSENLFDWTFRGEAINDCSHEGPNVFEFKNKYYMIVDCWDGQVVYSSDDLTNWKRQKNNILKKDGKGYMDKTNGRHADVVVNGDKAYIFYFTNPNRKGILRRKLKFYDNIHKKDTLVKYQTTAVQVAELDVDNEGNLICNRDKEIKLNLK